MNFAFHPEAEAEFLEAIAYYEERAPGLGLDFSAEVRAGIQRILAFPHAWQVLGGEIRRAGASFSLWRALCGGGGAYLDCCGDEPASAAGLLARQARLIQFGYSVTKVRSPPPLRRFAAPAGTSAARWRGYRGCVPAVRRSGQAHRNPPRVDSSAAHRPG